MLYRELKQSLVDIEKMFGLINEEPDIKDKANLKKFPIQLRLILKMFHFLMVVV